MCSSTPRTGAAAAESVFLPHDSTRSDLFLKLQERSLRVLFVCAGKGPISEGAGIAQRWLGEFPNFSFLRSAQETARLFGRTRKECKIRMQVFHPGFTGFLHGGKTGTKVLPAFCPCMVAASGGNALQ